MPELYICNFLNRYPRCVLHRITKYPLLLKELQKCTKEETNADYNKLPDAIKLAKDVACFVNLRIRETENANRLERLQKSIDNQIEPEMETMGQLHVSLYSCYSNHVTSLYSCYILTYSCYSNVVYNNCQPVCAIF